jgi:small subunit ribosomal protein S6
LAPAAVKKIFLNSLHFTPYFDPSTVSTWSVLIQPRFRRCQNTHFIPFLRGERPETILSMSKKYELLLVLPGTFDDKEIVGKADEIVNIVKELASDVELNSMGKNRLAYPIKQIRYGYFHAITFTAEPTALKVLEDKLRLHREVLRFLVSHFSTNLTAQQKIAYTTDGTGITRMVERENSVFTPSVSTAVTPGLAPEPKAEKLDIDQINKKLEDLIGGEVSGV